MASEFQGKSDKDSMDDEAFMVLKRSGKMFLPLKRSGTVSLRLKRPGKASLCLKRSGQAFTLAELLIALAILGVIATFTIPKVLQTQQDSRWNAMAKEAAGTISSAYAAYVHDNGSSTLMTPADLKPYLNYVKVDTTTSIDDRQGGNTFACGTSCLRLHNGAVLMFGTGASFGGTNSTNAVYFYFDPDGTTDGTTNGPGKSVIYFLYYNGKLMSYQNIPDGTATSGSTYNHCPGCDPPWFSWDR